MSNPNDTTSHYTATKVVEKYELRFILNDSDTGIVLDSKKEAIDMANRIYYAITGESKIIVNLVEMKREIISIGGNCGDSISDEYLYNIPDYFVNLILSKYNMMIKRVMRSIR